MILQIKIEGIHCGGCVSRIERVLRQEGATRFEMDLSNATAQIEIDETKVDPEMLLKSLKALGYRAKVVEASDGTAFRQKKSTSKTDRTIQPSGGKHRRCILGAGVVMVLFATLFVGISEWSRAAFLKRHDLDGLDVVEIVDRLEQKIDEAPEFQASITATKLILADSNGTFVFQIPKDRFYLSIAPYVQRTHPCGNHSLVGCDGELKLTPFHVIIRNAVTNEVLHDSEVVSSGKGFFGIWVPRNLEIVVTVHSAYGSATTTRLTNADSGTCVTTMILN